MSKEQNPNSKRAYALKPVTLKLANHPTLIFDPSNQELEWTVSSQNQAKSTNTNKDSKQTQDEDENALTLAYQTLKQEIQSLSEKLEQQKEENSYREKRLREFHDVVQQMKHKYSNIRMSGEQAENLWGEYQKRFL